MNLHEVPTVDLDKPKDATDLIHCPTCGVGRWQRMQYGTYSERRWIDLENNYDDWDNNETEFQEADPWECINFHAAPEAIRDELDDF